jgi:hypothetical protein
MLKNVTNSYSLMNKIAFSQKFITFDPFFFLTPKKKNDNFFFLIKKKTSFFK